MSQRVTINDIPPREQGEAPATQKQLEYLRHLANFNESDLQSLGKWQASFLIDRIKDIKDERPYKKKKTSGCTCLALVIISLFLIFVLVGAVKSCSDESAIQTKNAQKSESIKNTKSDSKLNQESAPEQIPVAPKIKKPFDPFAEPSDDMEDAPTAPIEPDKPLDKVLEKPITKAPIDDLILRNFEGAVFPLNITVIKTVLLRDESGKEITILPDAIIVVDGRSEKGILTLSIKGARYVGDESRVLGKVKKAD